MTRSARNTGRLGLGATAVLVAAWAPATVGQDTNYWTDQFGNSERLLAGAVVASVSDTGAVYYNPGALALHGSYKALVAANVIDLSTLDGQRPGAGTQTFSDSRFRWLPSLIAGELKFGWLGKSRLAYSFLTRQDVSWNLEDRRNFVPVSGALPLSSAYLDSRLAESVSEYWGGITWARPIGSSVGVGITMFGAVRNASARPEATIQALQGIGGGAVAIGSQDFDYMHTRLLWKLGLTGKLGPWKLGLTCTTPSVGLFGSGSAGYDASLASTGTTGQPGLAVVTTNYQESVSAHFKSPLSIGAGLARSLGSTQLHLSAEWFDRVAPMAVLDTVPFTSQSTGKLVDNNITYGVASVFNVAAGVQYDFGPSWHGYLGFRTDKSGALPQSQSNSTFLGADLYHAAAGATVKVHRVEIAFGVGYAWGSSEVAPLLDRLPALVTLDLPPLSTQFHRYTFLIGLNLPFESRTP